MYKIDNFNFIPLYSDSHPIDEFSTILGTRAKPLSEKDKVELGALATAVLDIEFDAQKELGNSSKVIALQFVSYSRAAGVLHFEEGFMGQLFYSFVDNRGRYAMSYVDLLKEKTIRVDYYRLEYID